MARSQQSRAARLAWKDPDRRRRQSIAIKGRKLLPSEPPPIPLRVQNLLRTLDRHDIDIVASSPSHCYPNYQNAWMVYGVDLVNPDSNRFKRFATEARLTMFIFTSDPLLPPKQGFKIGLLVGRADRKRMTVRVPGERGRRL